MNLPLTLWPDPMVLTDGSTVTNTFQWYLRRKEIMSLLLKHLYGDLPETPVTTRGVLLHVAVPNASAAATPRRIYSYRVEADGVVAFNFQLTTPDGNGPFPAVVHGDNCWNYANDTVIDTVLLRGYALVGFNRVEIMSDLVGDVATQTTSPALKTFVGGAIAAWAWGLHRVIDTLQTNILVDRSRLAVVGHSRGGKAALLAGALDDRIALTSANNSGAAGAGSRIFQGNGSETLAELMECFPHWLAGDVRHATCHDVPPQFDQHFLRALVAPRALLTTEALQDDWANPQGSQLAKQAAQPVFDFLGVPHHNAIVLREGGHAHTLQDWTSLLDYADDVFCLGA